MQYSKTYITIGNVIIIAGILISLISSVYFTQTSILTALLFFIGGSLSCSLVGALFISIGLVLHSFNKLEQAVITGFQSIIEIQKK